MVKIVRIINIIRIYRIIVVTRVLTRSSIIGLRACISIVDLVPSNIYIRLSSKHDLDEVLY